MISKIFFELISLVVTPLQAQLLPCTVLSNHKDHEAWIIIIIDTIKRITRKTRKVVCETCILIYLMI